MIYNNQIYVMGGYTQSGLGNALQVYDIASQTWTAGPPMPVSASGAAAAVMGTQIYVAGGYAGGLGVMNRLYIFDTATNNWITGPSLPRAVVSAGAAVSGNLLYVFGGQDPAGTPQSETDVYDPTKVQFVYTKN